MPTTPQISAGARRLPAVSLPRPAGAMPAAIAARLRRGYFASVTYTDRNVGRILAAAEPMLPDTVVALIGDHGWSLGEQNEWCKMVNPFLPHLFQIEKVFTIPSR